MLESDSVELRRLLDATRPFARADDRIAGWQLASTTLLLLGCFVLVRYSHASPAHWLLILPISALFVRIFVLQHDAGHQSLFSSRRMNELAGYFISIITSVAHEGWSTEHNWHHSHQGKLTMRGVDEMNSPLTVKEAIESPQHASAYQKAVSFISVFAGGSYALMIRRRRAEGFFPFRETFRGPVNNRKEIIRSLWFANTSHLLWHVAVFLLLGPLDYFTVFLVAVFLSSGFGASLFWVQHHHVESYQAWDDDWRYAQVGLRGSSYVDFDPIMRWVTAGIGLHHVHHLNARIPNYHLEKARAAIPEIAAVKPIDWAGIRSCYTHHYWDEETQAMISFTELASRASPR